MTSRVAIVHDRNYGRGIKTALSLLDDLPALFSGKPVVIKPNETWASEDDLTACTQAEVLRALIRCLRRLGAPAITVSGGSGAGHTEEVFELLGFAEVIRQEQVEFFDHNRPLFQEVSLTYGPQEQVMVNPRVLEFSTLVSLAQLKVHHLVGVTLTMKNLAMSLPAADFYGHPRSNRLRPHLFFKDLHSFIAGMCQRFPFQLGIIVGHPAMIGRGPIGGKTFEAHLTIAGTDFVAVDAIGAQLLGVDRVRYIEEAAALGLGTADLDEIEVVGLSLAEARRVFQKQAARGRAPIL
jgi:uncharacterized protein (DUF362 family)